MTRRQWLAITASAATANAQDGLNTHGAARDLLYQALEQLSTRAKPTEVRDAISLIRGALDQYPGFGDAYYFRHLCLKRLNQDAAQQTRDLRDARKYESEALREGLDPFTLAVPKIDVDLTIVAQKWALVVGISQFKKPNGATPLQYAAADATVFAELLRDPKIGRFPPQQVFLLVNEAATTANIKARLNTIARKAGSRDMVVVYIATHGTPREQDLREISFLYTHDTDTSSRDAIFGSALSMVDVSLILVNRCLAQRTVSIFDTCHSGAANPGLGLSKADMNRFTDGAGRYVLSSCGADQYAYEADGHGYFTASLVGKLRAAKGCVKINDLFQSVQAEVSSTVRRKHGKLQTPVMLKSDSAAEIILGIAPGRPVETCLS